MIRDKRDRNLPDNPGTSTAAAGRLVTGLYVRRPEALASVEYVTAQIIAPQGRPLRAISAPRVTHPADTKRAEIKRGK